MAVRVVEMPPSPLTQVKAWLGPLVAPLTTAGMVVVLVFFMLLDRENQRNRLIQLSARRTCTPRPRPCTTPTQRVGRYLRMLFLINAGYGVAVGLGLVAHRRARAPSCGACSGFALRFLPYLGPWIAAAMPILVSLAVSDGWTQPLLVIGLYIVSS